MSRHSFVRPDRRVVHVGLTIALIGGLAAAIPPSSARAESDPSPAEPPPAELLPSAPIDPGPHLVEFALPNPNGAPNDIVAGADGSVWVSVFNDKQILRISHDGAVIATAQLTGGPTSLTTDDSGGVWATEYASNAIAHVTAAAAVTEYPIPTPNSFPANIDVFKGYVYFTESNTQNLGRFNPANGRIDEYPIVGAATPWDVRGDENTGSLYITDTDTGTVWKRYLNGEDQGTFPKAAGLVSFGGDTGSTDSLLTGYVDDEVRALNTTSGFSAVVASHRSAVSGAVTVRARGNELWFVDSGLDTFTFKDLENEIHDIVMPSPKRELSGLAVTSDRYIWSAEKATGKLARLDVAVTIPVDRISGATRYETAVEVSTRSYPDGASVTFVTSGETFADALSAGPIAAARKAPLLLTPRSALASGVRDELVRLRPSRVIVVGGTAALSDGVFDSIQTALPRAAVQRIGGSDRYAVSRALLASDLAPRGSERIYITTGQDFPDALSAAPLAGRNGSVILLVDGRSERLSDEQMKSIAGQLSPAAGKPLIVGGPNAVSAALESQLRSTYHLTFRYTGKDRFEVSTALNAGWGSGRHAYIASGLTFPDALAAGAAAGAQERPIYLARANCLPVGALDALVIQRGDAVTLLGGTSALTADVQKLTPCP